MSRFFSVHPTVSALYFISVLCITMFSANPFLILISLIGGILLFVKIQKHIKLLKVFGFYLILLILISLTNPLFSHKGITILFFLNGNPITLEAVFYGINLAVMLIAVMYWFKCLNLIITEDKLLYLFGNVSPKLSLTIASALRLIPLLKMQAAKIRLSQKAMGLYASDTWSEKLKGTLRVYSALITWSLENAIDTGASMKARGYGIKGRSHYSLYKFRKSDAAILLTVFLLDAVIITVIAIDKLNFSFYPKVLITPFDIYNVMAIIAFLILGLLPFILEVRDDLLWKYYKSKI